MNDKELDAYCEEWVHWCYTRKFYLQPGAQNILARMQPSKSKEPPNARNSAEMQYFNMAVHAMADMKEHESAYACFKACYVEQPDSLKREIARLEISRGTYYNRTRAFTRQAISLARSLKTAADAMRKADLVSSD